MPFLKKTRVVSISSLVILFFILLAPLPHASLSSTIGNNDLMTSNNLQATTASNQPKRAPIPQGAVRNNLGLNFITTYHINPIDPNWDMVADPIAVLVNITSAVSLNVTAYQDFENITVVLIDEIPPPLGDSNNFIELTNISIPLEYNIGPMSASESITVTWHLIALTYSPSNPTRLMTAIGKNTDTENVTTVLFPRFVEMQLVQIMAPKMKVTGPYPAEYRVGTRGYEIDYEEIRSIWFFINSTGLTSITGIDIKIVNTEPEFVELVSAESDTSWTVNGTMNINGTVRFDPSNFNSTFFFGSIQELPPNNYTEFRIGLRSIKSAPHKSIVHIGIGNELADQDDYNITIEVISFDWWNWMHWDNPFALFWWSLNIIGAIVLVIFLTIRAIIRKQRYRRERKALLAG